MAMNNQNRLQTANHLIYIMLFNIIVDIVIISGISILLFVNRAEINFGNGYGFYGRRDFISGGVGQPTISQKVIRYAFDSQYILAKQKPESFVYDGSIYTSGVNCTYYWLIDKRTDEAIGPLDKDSFGKAIASIRFSPKMVRRLSRWGICHD